MSPETPSQAGLYIFEELTHTCVITIPKGYTVVQVIRGRAPEPFLPKHHGTFWAHLEGLSADTPRPVLLLVLPDEKCPEFLAQSLDDVETLMSLVEKDMLDHKGLLTLQ